MWRLAAAAFLLWSTGAHAQMSPPLGPNGSGNAGGGGSGTITANSTPTSGFTSGDLISTTSNLVQDSGIATSSVLTPSSSPTITGNWTWNGNILLGTGVLKAPAGGIQVTGSSTGVSQLQTALSGSSNNTVIFPAEATATLVDTTGTQALTNKTLNGLTVTGSTGTLTIANGKTATINNTLTLAGTDATTMTFPSSSDTVVTLGATQTLTNKTLTSPALTTPALGVATATSINNVAITQPASAATLTIANNKTLTVNNSLTFAGTDSSTLNVGGGGTLGSAAFVNTGTSGGTVPLLNGSPVATGQWSFTGSSLPQITVGSGGANAGDITFEGSSSGSFSIAATSTGTPEITGVPSSTAALSYMCYNTSTDVLSSDTSGTCLVSSLRFKHDVRRLRNSLAVVDKIDPISFIYNDQSNHHGLQEGVSAESVARADPLLVVYDDKGRPTKVNYFELMGRLVGAIQELKAENDNLRHRVERITAAR